MLAGHQQDIETRICSRICKSCSRIKNLQYAAKDLSPGYITLGWEVRFRLRQSFQALESCDQRVRKVKRTNTMRMRRAYTRRMVTTNTRRMRRTNSEAPVQPWPRGRVRTAWWGRWGGPRRRPADVRTLLGPPRTLSILKIFLWLSSKLMMMEMMDIS